MRNFIGPAPLCTFLNFCNRSPLEKDVLDCGAGGSFPPLIMFHSQGYKTIGIDISDNQLDKACKFCKENNVDLNITKGDMRNLPFKNESLSFIYSYNSIFHLNKEDTHTAISEMMRVLKSNGLLFVNFLSVDDCGYGDGIELNKGEFVQSENDTKVIHSYFEDNEPDKYFEHFDVIRKEKRLIQQKFDDGTYNLAYIDYIVKKL